MISVLSPSGVDDFEGHFQRLIGSRLLSPFEPRILDFIDAVSKSVLLAPSMRTMPEMMAAAHWMRRAHVLELKQRFEAARGDRILLPRGVVLHFAPSNVDSLFVYSWLISMLLGNANVVRVSSRRGSQVDALLDQINALCAQARFRDIQIRNLVITYDHNDAVTERLSEACHVRLLWGGDDSVRRLRAVPLNALATEIAFANRFSLAVLSAPAVTSCGADGLKELVSRFYRDAYGFDQMACSSPRLIAWVGSAEERVPAQRAFWDALAKEVERRGTEYPEMVGLNKQVAAYVAAARGVVDQVAPGVTSTISRVHVSGTDAGGFREIECGGGLFFEMELERLDELANVVTERDQTLSHFGFAAGELRHLALSLPTRAVDRMVPVGTALDFSTVWDGYDLIQILSRQVELLA
jgi:hypothetical protein